MTWGELLQVRSSSSTCDLRQDPDASEHQQRGTLQRGSDHGPCPASLPTPPPRSPRASCSGDTQLLGQKTKGLTEVQATRVPRRGTGGLRRRTSLRPWRKNLLEPVSTCLEEPPKKYGAQGRVRSHWGGPGLTRAGICLCDPQAWLRGSWLAPLPSGHSPPTQQGRGCSGRSRRRSTEERGGRRPHGQ